MPQSVFAEFFDELKPEAIMCLTAIECKVPSKINDFLTICRDMSNTSSLKHLLSSLIIMQFDLCYQLSVTDVIRVAETVAEPAPAQPEPPRHVLSPAAPSWADKAKIEVKPAPKPASSMESVRSQVKKTADTFECPSHVVSAIGADAVAHLASIHANHGLVASKMFGDDIFDERLLASFRKLKIVDPAAATSVIESWAKKYEEVQNPRNWMQRAINAILYHPSSSA